MNARSKFTIVVIVKLFYLTITPFLRIFFRYTKISTRPKLNSKIDQIYLRYGLIGTQKLKFLTAFIYRCSATSVLDLFLTRNKFSAQRQILKDNEAAISRYYGCYSNPITTFCMQLIPVYAELPRKSRRRD